MWGAIRVSSSTSFIDNALTVPFRRCGRIDEQEYLVIGRAYSSSMIYPMSGQGKIFHAVLRYVEQKSGAGNVSDAHTVTHVTWERFVFGVTIKLYA